MKIESDPGKADTEYEDKSKNSDYYLNTSCVHVTPNVNMMHQNIRSKTVKNHCDKRVSAWIAGADTIKNVKLVERPRPIKKILCRQHQAIADQKRSEKYHCHASLFNENKSQKSDSNKKKYTLGITEAGEKNQYAQQCRRKGLGEERCSPLINTADGTACRRTAMTRRDTPTASQKQNQSRRGNKDEYSLVFGFHLYSAPTGEDAGRQEPAGRFGNRQLPRLKLAARLRFEHSRKSIVIRDGRIPRSVAIY